MGQFDSPSTAALARLQSESLSSSPVDAVAMTVAGIGSKILDLIGCAGISTLADLVLALESLAANKDEANLIYFGNALVEDISRLYKMNDEMRRQVGELLETDEFHRAVANATLHITRTNVEARLRRIAALIANGVRMHDLEEENLDDMMRVAVELTERDILELRVFISRQSTILEQAEKSPMQWYDNIRRHWQSWAIEDGAAFRDGKLSYFELNSSRSKLASMGFIIAVPPVGTANSPDAFPYALLPAGKHIYERVQEISTRQ